MGMDIGGGFGAAGAVQGLQQLLAQRFAERQQAERERAALADEANRRQQLEEQMQWRQMQQKELERSHQESENIRRGQEANALGDQIPANAFLAKTDPAVGILQTGGRGALLNEQPERPQVAEGPLQPGDTGDARPPGYLKIASAKQTDTQTDNARQAAQAAEAQRHDRAMENKPDHASDTRVDRSYQYHRSALDKIAKPLEDQQQRMGRLIETVNQATPQSDALVAPELLTVMAGGAGSGLRMNEAEIARVIGGRSKWESLKATLSQWASDPTKANSITPDQRAQIRQLIAAVHDKSQAALGALNGAGDALIDTDVMGHRRILADTKKKLQSIYETPGTTTTDEGFVYARDPQGGLHKAKRGTALPAGWKEEQH